MIPAHDQLEALWLAVEPLDMRAGTEVALAHVVVVLGADDEAGSVPTTP